MDSEFGRKLESELLDETQDYRQGWQDAVNAMDKHLARIEAARRELERIQTARVIAAAVWGMLVALSVVSGFLLGDRWFG